MYIRAAIAERERVGILAGLAGRRQVHGRLSHGRFGVGQLLLGQLVGGHRLSHFALQGLEPRLGELELRRDVGDLFGCGGGGILRLGDLGLAGHGWAGGGPRGQSGPLDRFGGLLHRPPASPRTTLLPPPSR